MKELQFIGIIPARYASTRFPGKPLALLGGKRVIERVYEQVKQAIEKVIVATDDERLAQAVESFGGCYVMTRTDHKSGTDRCMEAYEKIGGNEDVIINVQGDEPFVQPSQLQAIMACFDDQETDIATLAKPYNPKGNFEQLANPNVPKVVIDKEWNAKYFSRSVIPYLRGIEQAEWPAKHQYYTHLGMYAYRAKVLKEITALPQSSLELAESLEQLRWLENGYTLKVGVSEVETIGIDTPEDLARAEIYLTHHSGC